MAIDDLSVNLNYIDGSGIMGKMQNGRFRNQKLRRRPSRTEAGIGCSGVGHW